jgi:hypothetical protein
MELGLVCCCWPSAVLKISPETQSNDTKIFL